MLEKLKQRWEVQSGWQVWMILLVFALTGTSVMYLKKFLFGWIGIDDATPLYIRILLSVLVIFPLYQVLLLMYGWLLGQFSFFWKFEKKMLQRLRLMPKTQ
jgi:hypothetical protein